MKKVSLLLFIAAGMLAMSAQQKVMRIHHADGTSETHKVADVLKITFETKGTLPIRRGPRWLIWV